MTVPALNFKMGSMSLSSFPEVVADTEEEVTAESEEEIEKVSWLMSITWWSILHITGNSGPRLNSQLSTLFLRSFTYSFSRSTLSLSLRSVGQAGPGR